VKPALYFIILATLAVSCKSRDPRIRFDNLITNHPWLLQDSVRSDTSYGEVRPPVIIVEPADTAWRVEVIESTTRIDELSRELEAKDSSYASLAQELRRASSRINDISKNVNRCDEDWEYTDDKVSVGRIYDRGSGAWKTTVQHAPDRTITITKERYIQAPEPGWALRAWRGWSTVSGVIVLLMMVGYGLRSYIRRAIPFR